MQAFNGLIVIEPRQYWLFQHLVFVYQETTFIYYHYYYFFLQ